MKTLVRAAVLATALTVPMLSAAPASALVAPRPGCGYGDANHAHQAAPGRDPLGLRPGSGAGDTNHPHAGAPGQAPVGAGDQSGPMRGCKTDPRG